MLSHESLSGRVVTAAIWSCVAAGFLRGFSFAAWVFCARYLGKSAFGELSIVISTAGTLGVLAGMGLGVTATRYTAAYRSIDGVRTGRVLGLTLLFSALSGGLFALLMLMFAPFTATHLLHALQLAPALRIAALLPGLNALSACQTGALAGYDAFRPLAFVNLVSGIVTFSLVGSCTYCGGLKGAVWALVTAQAFNCVLNQMALWRECGLNSVRFSLAGCWRELPVLWRSALPAVLSSAFLLPAVWFCNIWLARQPDGYLQLGLYAAADRWRLLILFVPGSLAGTVLSVLSNLSGTGDGHGFQRVFRTNALANCLFALVPGVVIAVLARPLLSVFGPAYREGWPVLSVLAIAACAEAMNTALGQAVVVESMWRRFAFDVLLVSTLGSSAWLLVPRWGALGLAVAFLLAYSVLAVTLYWYTRHKLTAAGGVLAC
jgi:O-antigen/teichoic acid export membrane protein